MLELDVCSVCEQRPVCEDHLSACASTLRGHQYTPLDTSEHVPGLKFLTEARHRRSAGTAPCQCGLWELGHK